MPLPREQQSKAIVEYLIDSISCTQSEVGEKGLGSRYLQLGRELLEGQSRIGNVLLWEELTIFGQKMAIFWPIITVKSF